MLCRFDNPETGLVEYRDREGKLLEKCWESQDFILKINI